MQRIRICYSSLTLNALCFCKIYDYEDSEYNLASRKSFPYTDEGETEALEYARKLAKQNGMSLNTDALTIDTNNYLD